MANVVMNQLKKGLADGSIDLVNDVLKFMLCNTTYVPGADDTFIDDGSVDDAASGEIVATNYTGGFAGAGRKTVAGKVVTQDNVNDRAELDFTDPSWTALGGAANDTVAWAVLVKEVTTDADSLVLIAYDVTNTATNGSDFTLTVDAEGGIQIT